MISTMFLFLIFRAPAAQPELLVTMAHPDSLEYLEKWVPEDSPEIGVSQVKIQLQVFCNVPDFHRYFSQFLFQLQVYPDLLVFLELKEAKVRKEMKDHRDHP
jgi:hypothetical protein